MTPEYIKKYGAKPSIGIYSNFPNLIIDNAELWNIHYLGPIDPEFKALVTADPVNLRRHVIRAHDRKIDIEFSHVLYVTGSTAIDLSKLAGWLDLDHNAYFDTQNRFALYRRETFYNLLEIDQYHPPFQDIAVNEFRNGNLGVIFIDCWPNNFQWLNPKVKFYENMLATLARYPIRSYVFHTSFLALDIITPDTIRYLKTFVNKNLSQEQQYKGVKELLEFSGEERVASELVPLLSNPNSILITTLDGFQHWTQTQEIDQWIVVGMHWQLCIHNKPLGFNNLKKLKERNPLIDFYSLPNCTAVLVKDNRLDSLGQVVARTCTADDYINDSLEWEFIDETASLVKLK